MTYIYIYGTIFILFDIEILHLLFQYCIIILENWGNMHAKYYSTLSMFCASKYTMNVFRSILRDVHNFDSSQTGCIHLPMCNKEVYALVSFIKYAQDTHIHSTKKPVTTMLTYPWKCTVLHCNHLGNTWKPLVLMTRHFDYCPSASEGDNQSVRSSAPVVSRCFPGGYNVKLYISRGRLAWWLLAFLHSDSFAMGVQCPICI